MAIASTTARAVEPAAVAPVPAAAEPAAAGAAAPAAAGPEGPALPPSSEHEQRLADLAEKVAAAEARAAAVEAQAASDLAEERAEREALQHRLDYVQAVEENMGVAMARAERGAQPVTTARAGLSLTGFLHADYTVRQSSQDQLNTANTPLNEDRFNIRRARLRAVLEREYVTGAVEFDGNTTRGATARILGAEASLRWPAPKGHEPPLLMLTVGAFKIPFGFEVLQSDRDRLFFERSTAERALFPGEYDLGARLQGGWRVIRYAVAVMNGEPAGESSGFPGRDPNHQKDIVGRVGVDVGVVERLSVAAGLSALAGTGFHPGAPATKPTVIWQDRNQDGMAQSNEVSASAMAAATPSLNFKRQAIGGDVRIVANLLSLGETVGYGEFYVAKNLDRGIQPADPKSTDPKAAGRDLREVGAYLALTQQVWRHGMVGFRYDYYNPDRDSRDTLAAILIPQTFVYQTFAFTAALTSESGRLIFEYDVNRNHQGRDTQGEPTNLKDNAFLVRAEAKF